MRPTKNYFEYGEFGRTAINFLENSNAWINIAHGSVRSGKTIACNARWLTFLAESNSHEFLISGKTSKSLKRNVINKQDSALSPHPCFPY